MRRQDGGFFRGRSESMWEGSPEGLLDGMREGSPDGNPDATLDGWHAGGLTRRQSRWYQSFLFVDDGAIP